MLPLFRFWINFSALLGLMKVFLGQFSEERRLCKEAAAAPRYDKCNFIGLLEGAANGTMKKRSV